MAALAKSGVRLVAFLTEVDFICKFFPNIGIHIVIHVGIHIHII